jgi:uroporphyrinogen-III synthase
LGQRRNRIDHQLGKSAAGLAASGHLGDDWAMVEIASPPQLRALVTRPRAGANALAAALSARGIAPILEPLLEIRFRDPAPLDLRSVQALLCTSANGVQALALATGERSLPLYAVGEATAAKARDEGFLTVRSTGGDAADLARLAARDLRPRDGRLLHVAGSVVAGDLAGMLRTKGFAIDREIRYEARTAAALSPPTVQALRMAEVDFALFFSPRTAAAFARLAHMAGVAADCRTVTALSISAAVDAALDGLPWRDRHLAERPNQPALLTVLDHVLATRRQCGDARPAVGPADRKAGP